MRSVLDKIEARETAAREEAARLREQIAQLTAQLATAEHSLERLKITRETLLEIAGEHDTASTEPLTPAYRQILALFEESGHSLHAKDICQALGTGTEPRHIESARAKLKRLVSRGILAEPEPGLFTMPRPASRPAAT